MLSLLVPGLKMGAGSAGGTPVVLVPMLPTTGAGA